MKKIYVGLYGGFGNEKIIGKTLYCDSPESCSLYKNGKCAHLLPFSSCKYGRFERVTGYTKRSRRRGEFESKYRNDELYSSLKPPHDLYVYTVGDDVILNLQYVYVDKDVMIDGHNTFLKKNMSIIKRKYLTGELLFEIIDTKPIDINYNPIMQYSEDVVPHLLEELKKIMPELYRDVVDIDPSLEEKEVNYVGSIAYVDSIRDGSKIYSNINDEFVKNGDYIECQHYTSAFMPFESKEGVLKIKITPEMKVKVHSNDIVDENTRFD